MNTVQFRWEDIEGNIHIVGQFQTSWVFRKDETFHAWGSAFRVSRVYMHFIGENDVLKPNQIVYVVPVHSQFFYGSELESEWIATGTVS